MFFTSSNSNISLINVLFHSLLSCTISSSTLALSFNLVTGTYTQKEVKVVSHLSPHIFMFFLSPTLHLNPSFNNSDAFHTLFQIKEAIPPSLACKKEESLKCFCLKIWATKLLGLCTSLHPCFVSKARLKHSTFLKPRPPFYFCCPNLFQLHQ